MGPRIHGHGNRSPPLPRTQEDRNLTPAQKDWQNLNRTFDEVLRQAKAIPPQNQQQVETALRPANEAVDRLNKDLQREGRQANNPEAQTVLAQERLLMLEQQVYSMLPPPKSTVPLSQESTVPPRPEMPE